MTEHFRRLVRKVGNADMVTVFLATHRRGADLIDERAEQTYAEYQRLRERAAASAPDAGEAGTSSQPTQALSEDELWIAAAGGLHRGTYYGTGSYGPLVATQSSRTSPASVHGPQPSQESARVHQMMESLRDDLLRRIEEQSQYPTDDPALLARLDALDRGIMDLMETTERTERTVGGLERTVTELQTGQMTMAERMRLTQESMVESIGRMLSIMDSYHQRLAALERAGVPGAPSSSSTPPPPLPSSSTPTPPTSLPPSVSISREEYELFLSLRRGGAPSVPDS
ncbi:hypothetical protein M6B38_345850 [Iris pallida]|uniref:Uncharacterized protein n=1 Tax=Iris pallida TaxID=29817 RepID=A0AAX6GTV0_IRIPA|nr:hypothetical protein M6B38_345850 [Iris pallida]